MQSHVASIALMAGLAALGLAPSLAKKAPGPPEPRPVLPGEITQGTLIPVEPYNNNTGQLCPLKRTDVRAEISGSLARVRVKQIFRNTAAHKIEAVYAFPLPNRAAVDEMTMIVGDRRIVAEIRKRAEATQIYEQARDRGHVAALLDQERPNLFTQRVANIEPGATVEIEIAYVETLKYDEGHYDFTFPMTVGPRYIPGSPAGKQGAGWSPDTDIVPDGSRVTPKYAPAAVRAGHDITLEVKLDAGVPVHELQSTLHEVSVQRLNGHAAQVKLKQGAEIPNRDFILRYRVAGERMTDALLAHRGQRGGYFTLILQPPQRVTAEDVTPKELVFVLDTSGSMSGFPMEKAKETMKLAMQGLYPRDTFNLITFAGDTQILFPHPVAATEANLHRALQFLEGRRGSGGTEMMKAVKAAFQPTGEQGAIRIICFMTDGYVGNEDQILAEVRTHPEARIFSFGIGNSVNRYLLDKMAEEGRGEVEYVTLKDDGSAAARRFHERVRNPLLTGLRLEWNGLPVADVYPRRLPDLFSAKPVVIHGRYTGPATGTLRLAGMMSGRPYSRDLRVEFPASQPAHGSLATLWARSRVEDLAAQDYAGMQQRRPKPEIEAEITRLGLAFRLATPFTSFVAVDSSRTTAGGPAERVEVPIEMPDGVSHEGVFGMRNERALAASPMAKNFAAQSITQSAGAFDAAVRQKPLPQVMLPPAAPRAESDSKLPRELRGVTSGRVRVEIWLADAAPAVLERLRKLGFQPDGTAKVAKIQVGWIDAGKLVELAGWKEVTAVRRAASR